MTWQNMFTEEQCLRIEASIRKSINGLKEGIAKRGDGQHSGHTEFDGNSPDVYYSVTKYMGEDLAKIEVWPWSGGEKIGNPVRIYSQIENIEQATVDMLMPFFKYAIKQEK